jgi:hypothetical protein
MPPILPPQPFYVVYTINIQVKARFKSREKTWNFASILI